MTAVTVDVEPHRMAVRELVDLALAAKPPSHLAETFRGAILGLAGPACVLEFKTEILPATDEWNYPSRISFVPSKLLCELLAALRAEDWGALTCLAKRRASRKAKKALA